MSELYAEDGWDESLAIGSSSKLLRDEPRLKGFRKRWLEKSKGQPEVSETSSIPSSSHSQTPHR